jgi:hypothetical protein
VSIDGEGFEGGTLIDWNLRHSEDDYFVINNCTVTGSTCRPGTDDLTDQKLVLRRLRVGYMGCTGGSCSIIDTNSAGPGQRDFNLDLDGLLAEDPSGEVNVSSNFYLGGDGIWNVRNIALVAGEQALFQGFGGEFGGAENTSVRNLYDIGRDVGTYSIDIVGVRFLGDASLIDTRMPANVANLRTTWTHGGSWKGILVLDPRNNFAWLLGAFDPGAALSIQDLAIVGFDRSAGRKGFAVWIDAPSGARNPVRLERLTLALRPGQRTAHEGAIRYSGDDTAFDAHRSLTGLLVANFAGDPSGTGALALAPGDLDGLSDVCLEDNESDGLPAAGVAGTLLRDAGLRFADPERGNFNLRSDSPGYGICGARDPGAQDMWALRVLHHDPYRFGDSWKTAESSGSGDDGDLDGVADGADNCPFEGNSNQEDRDSDLLGDLCDLCPDHPGGGNGDRDANGIGDVCECGDESGDGHVDVADLLAINLAIRDPAQASALCDTNDDRLCDVRDLFGAMFKIRGGAAYCSRYPPPDP